MKPIDRFMAKVVVEPSGCWRWTAAIHSQGYGVFWGQRWMRAHRWIYEYVHGPVPTGLVLDHFACDNRWCVNPDHVRPVTVRENTLRGTSLAAAKAAQHECLSGHEFTPTNTRVRANGTRRCRECERQWQREYRLRVRQRAMA